MSRSAKTILIAAVLALSASSACLAQSQRNYGPNPPPGDTFGVPASGSEAARRPLYNHYGWHHGFHRRFYRGY